MLSDYKTDFHTQTHDIFTLAWKAVKRKVKNKVNKTRKRELK